MPDNLVNGQIVDSVADVVTLTHGTAPSQAFAMLDTVMVETLGMAMYNAVSRQQGGGMIGSAAVTAACAKMLGTPFGPASSPPTQSPPHVDPLPPVPSQPHAVIAAATAEAETAIKTIRRAGGASSDDADLADKNLKMLAKEATAPPTTSTTSTPPTTQPTTQPPMTPPTPPHVTATMHPVSPAPVPPAVATSLAAAPAMQAAPVVPAAAAAAAAAVVAPHTTTVTVTTTPGISVPAPSPCGPPPDTH